MSARTTRRDARARIPATFTVELDRMIPEEEEKPLKGATFRDFEDQVVRPALPMVFEERAALEPNARARNIHASPS